MKADAYAFASEGKYSREISKLRAIERFGLEAITGRRTFYLSEYNQLIVAENVVTAYQSSKRSQNWAEWTASNPRQAELLNEAIRLYDAASN